MSTTTQAQKLADLFDNDGQTRATKDGRNMLQAAKDLGASIEYPEGRGMSPIVYVFEDGSAVVELDGGWDFRAEGCTAHCWDGIGCDCADRAAQAACETVRAQADDLIARSIRHDQITHAEWARELEDELLTRAEDSVDNGEVYEVWGEADGDDWRVHLDKPTSEA